MALNYAYAILGTAVVCTGMIMDEEVLVLYAFILFVALAYHYGSSVVDGMIRSEAEKVSKEFDAFFDVQKKVLKTLIQYHGLQVAVISQVKELLEFSKGEISTIISAKKASLDATLAEEMDAKLAFLAAKGACQRSDSDIHELIFGISIQIDRSQIRCLHARSRRYTGVPEYKTN